MSRRRPMPYPHLFSVSRELATAYRAVETATAILHNDRGPKSVPVQRGLKAMIAIDKLRESIEPIVRQGVTSDAAAVLVVYGRDALAKSGSEDES